MGYQEWLFKITTIYGALAGHSGITNGKIVQLISTS